LPNSAVLIDTSVWVDYLRGQNQQLVEMVKGLIITQRARLCGLVLAELLSGVRAKEDRDVLERTLEALAYLEVSRLTWTLTGEMSTELRVRGVRIPLTDLVVAALAIEHDCEFLTSDGHFDHVPRLKRFKPTKP